MADLVAIFLMGLVMFGDEGNSSTMPPTTSPSTVLLQPLHLIYIDSAMFRLTFSVVCYF
jgi:hypothetical protein